MSEQLFTCASAAPSENAQAEPPTEYIKKKAAAGCRAWLNVEAFIIRIEFWVILVEYTPQTLPCISAN